MQLHHFFEHSCDLYPDNIALVCDNAFISYQELEHRANQLAHYLAQQKIKKGSIVAILLERSIESYIAILASLKVGAAYVPIEVDYPEERINYILSDLAVDLLLTSSQQRNQKNLNWPNYLALDELSPELATQAGTRLTDAIYHTDANSLCYVIYTSGSTGKPKGVEITHKNICHYVDAASQVYEMTEKDRVYQGFSLAFDASLEELWMAFAHGAALIACTQKEVRSGLGLTSFLQQHQVTVFSTVPTLLSTLEGQLPHLRLLILGGEMCSSSLVKKWMRPDLKIMNTYGPTEATVVTTYFECHPHKEVTIGRPLPGYEVFILDEQGKKVPAGAMGELCVGGPAVARGYVNKPEITAEKFIEHDEQRLYRTGDLVMLTATGDLQFAGRVDDQIKLRGFRIELNEIESVLLDYPGIKQAVVALQTLDQPTLVAYLLPEQKASFDLNGLKEFLRSRLPDYMMPSAFEFLEAFPLLSSGKVNRKALPLPTQKLIAKEYKAPETVLEKEIARVWEKVLGCGPVSIDADFFYDLGGHSLWAAQIISHLRKIPALSTISILDLYKNPNVEQLAQKFKHYAKQNGHQTKQAKDKYTAPHWKYILCGIGQFFGCVFQYAVGAWQLLAVILCYAWISSKYSLVSTESQVAFLALFLSMPFISMMITVSLKWLLLGRVKPGIYPLWSWFYYRWWLIQRLQKNVYLGKHLSGSPLINLYYRLLGAKIGENCHIGTTQIFTPDLVSIGNNVSLGTDSRLNGYIIEDGWLKIGTIEVGDDCYIGSRTVLGINSCMQDKSVLEDMSMIPDGAVLEAGSYYVGSPAVVASLPKNHPTMSQEKAAPATLLEHSVFGILHYLGIVFVMVMYYLCILPSISLISYTYDRHEYWGTMLLAIPAGAILFLTLYYLCLIVCKKIILDRIKPGSYPVRSFYYLRHWIIEKMYDVDEISVMADTLYLPMFLRCLGAKLGKGVEMGETPHVIPDLVTIEEGGFIASSVALAWPSVYQGIISFSPVRIGKKGFAGNVSLLPGGKTIGDRSLLGSLSLPPENNDSARADTAWLGSPAVFLPKREVFTGFSDQQTYDPPKKLYYVRLGIELFRIILPTAFSFVALFNLLYILDFMLDHYSWLATALVLPFAEFFITVGLVSLLVGLKWLLLGKLKPLTKPIWDIFIWKNDVIEYSYNYYINPHYTNKVLGTPFAMWLHRCLGTKVGKRVFTDSAEFSEFDLITIGDDVCINAETILQTHLYEDRIFKVSQVTINKGANIGVGSIILYNTLMEENSTLGSLSLLMKGERLPANTQWAGIPAQTTLAVQPELSGIELVEEEELTAVLQ
ncbi:amino acid adenylation domain-containing protein [Legionella sp. km772]|nr:amino acid adenylation domain-containing protein [Legionella sp. km772]